MTAAEQGARLRGQALALHAMVDAARGVKVPSAATDDPWILIPEVASGEPGEEQPSVDRLGVYMSEFVAVPHSTVYPSHRVLRPPWKFIPAMPCWAAVSM
jgi:hypothetical protein